MAKEMVVAYEFGSHGELSEFTEFLSENGIDHYTNGMRVIVSKESEGECNDFFYLIDESPEIDRLRELEGGQNERPDIRPYQ